MSAAAASYVLFFIRGLWMMRSSPLLAQRWVKIIPHVVDTVLLASAITMAILSRQYPFQASWLTAKVLALVLYIALGMAALRLAPSLRSRIGAWIAAQLVFFYIIAVAVTRDPLPLAH